MSLPPVIRDIRLLPAAQPSASATSNAMSKTDAPSTKISPKHVSTWTASPGRSRRASFVEGLSVEIPTAEPLPSAAKAQATFNTSVFSPLKPKAPSKRSSTPNPSSQGTLSLTAATSTSPAMPLGSFPPLHKRLGTGPYFLHPSSSPHPSSTSNASSSGNSSVASSPTISPSRFSLFHSSSSPTFPLFRPTSPTTGSPKTSFPGAFILSTTHPLFPTMSQKLSPFPKPPVTASSASSIAQSEASTTSSRSPTPSPRKPHQGPAASVSTTSASSASSTTQMAAVVSSSSPPSTPQYTTGTASSSTKPKPQFSISGFPMGFKGGST